MNVLDVRQVDGDWLYMGPVERRYVQVGDTVDVMGMNQQSKNTQVRSIGYFEEPVAAGFAGEMIAMRLTPTDLIQPRKIYAPRRGMMVFSAGRYRVVQRVRGRVRRYGNRLVLNRAVNSSERLHHRSEIKLYNHGADVIVQVFFAQQR